MLNEPDDSEKFAQRFNKSGGQFTARSWQEILPDLDNMIETDRVEGYVFMFILYMVIAFGIFGTMLMMLAERMHEFGVLVAVGMKRFKLSIVVFLEIVSISLMGAFLGMLGAFPVCTYFNINPITFTGEISEMYEEFGFEPLLRASVDPMIFFQQAVIVFPDRIIDCYISTDHFKYVERRKGNEILIC